jgi:hypothetical protein
MYYLFPHEYEEIFLLDIMVYAASTEYVRTVYQDYFNFQVQPPNILNIRVMDVSCCFCQRLEVVTKWAVCWGFVHLMPCTCLPQVKVYVLYFHHFEHYPLRSHIFLTS